MNDIANLSVDTLRTYYRDASDCAAVALPGTSAHVVRVAWVSKLAAELTRRGCTLMDVPHRGC